MSQQDELVQKFGEMVRQGVTVQLEPVMQQLAAIEKRQKTQGRDLRYVKKTMDILVRRTDEKDVDLEKRTKRIESFLALPQMK